MFGADLIDVAAGVLLQGGFPNPTWMKGRMKVRYKILGIGGAINAKINLGTPCQVETNGDELPEIIFNVTPNEGTEDYNIFSPIQVNFNIPMGTEFDLEGQTIKTVVDTLTLFTADGQPLEFEQEWDDDRLGLLITPYYTLPSNDSIIFRISTSVFRDGEQEEDLVNAQKVIGFKTSTAELNIPNFNISLVYPVEGMHNFYPKENTDETGWIDLKRNQFDLEKLYDEDRLKCLIRGVEDSVITNTTYSFANNRIEFDLPPEVLDNEEYYVIRLIALESPLSIHGSYAPFNINDGAYEVIKSIGFRTSQYPTLYEKMDHLSENMTLEFEDIDLLSTECFSIPTGIEEPFDAVEINPLFGVGGLLDHQNLVQVQLDMDEILYGEEYLEAQTIFEPLVTQIIDPISNYYASTSGQTLNDRFHALNSTVRFGGFCESWEDVVPSEVSTDQILSYVGNNLSLANNEGNTSYNINGEDEFNDDEIASHQALSIRTFADMNKIVQGIKFQAKLLKDRIIADCLNNGSEGNNLNNGQVNKRADEIPDIGGCAGEVPSFLDDILAANINFEGIPYNTVLPVQVFYNIPGSQGASSIKLINVQLSQQ